jgi:hypothetical protein
VSILAGRAGTCYDDSMKYCPKCESEYSGERDKCADCDIPLISASEFSREKDRKQQERDNLSKTKFVSVRAAENALEADRLKVALEQAGIPVLLRSFYDTAYDGIFVAQKGWGHVLVPESQKEEAEKIVADLSSIFEEEGKKIEAEKDAKNK